MKARSAMALMATASMATAARTGFFQLTASLSSAYQPNVAFDGFLLTSFHTGAGTSTIVTTSDANEASNFYIEDGALIQNSSYPLVLFVVDQQPYLSDAPEGYKLLSLSISTPEYGTRPFSYDATTSEVSLDQNDFAFALCNVNGTAPYFTLGPQTQLLWRQPSQSTADTRTPPKCADVALHAVEVKDYQA